ncbi:MAG: methyltransferase domain-containing protein [Anaerolineales bacterium]
MDVNRHQKEILLNQHYWQEKQILRMAYREFYNLIAAQLSALSDPLVVELGSGIGNIKEVIPGCLRTDLFANPWIDQVENAYQLSFGDGTVSDLILFDVFHHLRYPGTALREFERVLRSPDPASGQPGGRVLIFDPCISALGMLVFGALHPEPVAYRERIVWDAPQGWSPAQVDYYAAQGNATRIFFGDERTRLPDRWNIVCRQRFAALAYVASGGYSKPRFYPDRLYPFLRSVGQALELAPALFATRLLVVLEKKA